MHRTLLAILVCTAGLAGCAVVKTTDVTDAAFKRHQSVSLLGWPVYSRVTDKEPGVSSQVATRIEAGQDPYVRRAELLGGTVDLEFNVPEDK
jgi:hypothetical protein